MKLSCFFLHLSACLGACSWFYVTTGGQCLTLESLSFAIVFMLPSGGFLAGVVLLTMVTSLDNHMPPQTATKRTKFFYPSKTSPGRGEIRIIDGEGDGIGSIWTYDVKRVVKPSYILVLGEADERYRIEKFEEDYDCNLISTPSESNKAILQARYPQIDRGKDSERLSAETPSRHHGLEDDDESYLNDPIDENNPYDFRRWMRGDFNWFLEKDSKPHAKPASPSLSDRASINSVERNTKSSDRNDADDESSQKDAGQKLKRKPSARPITLKPKAKARKITHPGSDLGTPTSPQALQALDDELTIDFDPDTKSERAGSSQQAVHPARDDASQSAKSEVHQEEDQTESSGDDLVIEMEDTEQKRTLGGRPTSMGTGAPVSLRSVASSLSPPGTSGGSAKELDRGLTQPQQDVNGQQEEGDADIGEAPESLAPVSPRDADEEDELEAELAQALESEDYQPQQEQAEEESEEE